MPHAESLVTPAPEGLGLRAAAAFVEATLPGDQPEGSVPETYIIMNKLIDPYYLKYIARGDRVPPGPAPTVVVAQIRQILRYLRNVLDKRRTNQHRQKLDRARDLLQREPDLRKMLEFWKAPPTADRLHFASGRAC